MSPRNLPSVIKQTGFYSPIMSQVNIQASQDGIDMRMQASAQVKYKRRLECERENERRLFYELDWKPTDWVANRPTGVDFATLIFGYASNFLPEDFWDNYSV